MLVTHKIKMNLTDPRRTGMIETVQGDSCTRELALELCTGADEPWPIPADAAVLVRYRKSDGTGGIYDTLPDGSAAWSAEENLLRLTLAPQVLSAEGPVRLQAVLVRGEGTLATFTVLLDVKPDPAAGITQSEDYVSALGWMDQQLQLLLQQAKDSGEFDGADGTDADRLPVETVTVSEPYDDSSIDSALTGLLAQMTPGTRKNVDLVIESDYMFPISICAGTWALRLYKTAEGEGVAEGVNLLKFQYAYDDPAGLRVRRIFRDGWGPWLWEEPPMRPGTEYATTEQHNGKTVYTKLVNCGYLDSSANTTTVAHGCANVEKVLRCAGYIPGSCTLPLDGQFTLQINANPVNVTLWGTMNDSLTNVEARIWYTKR